MRKSILSELNPRFHPYTNRPGDPVDAITFDCPEGHEGCHHTIPFTPALDGSTRPVLQRNGAQWDRKGRVPLDAADLELLAETFREAKLAALTAISLSTAALMTLTPSIRVTPPFASREEAIRNGAIPEHVTERLLCAAHFYITDGVVSFCGDSK